MERARPRGRALSLWAFALAAGALASACARGALHGDPVARLAHADAVAARGGLARGQIEAGGFVLTRYLRAAPGAGRLVVYLDGDGDAWHRDRVRVRAQPPPFEPLALALAAADPAPAVAWLGRPCQLAPADAAGCEPSLWSDRRFAEPVVAALDAAVGALRREAGAARVELVGFSGGGVLAALLAARRDDVAALVTVAAPLDLGAWLAHHGLGPVEAADPARLTSERLDDVPQCHLLGERDAVVPPALLDGYRARRPRARVEVVPGMDHAGWAEGWPARIQAIRAAGSR